MSAATTTLATPLTLPNGAIVKNRLVKAAMSEQLGGVDHQPTPQAGAALPSLGGRRRRADHHRQRHGRPPLDR
jgi:hypothetical protein